MRLKTNNQLLSLLFDWQFLPLTGTSSLFRCIFNLIARQREYISVRFAEYIVRTHTQGHSYISVVVTSTWTLTERVLLPQSTTFSRMLKNLKNPAADDNIELFDDDDLSIKYRLRRQCCKYRLLVLAFVLLFLVAAIFAVIFTLIKKSNSEGMWLWKFD